MGTRSLTRIYDKNNYTGKYEQLINIYKQYDGYPSGWGKEIAAFLNGGKVVNGLGMDTKMGECFNGAADMAAQLLATFKTNPGNIYIYPPKAKDCGQEYEYEIRVDGSKVELKVIECGCAGQPNKTIFKGAPAEFLNSKLVKGE